MRHSHFLWLIFFTVCCLWAAPSPAHYLDLDAMSSLDKEIFKELLLGVPKQISTYDKTRESKDIVDKFSLDWERHLRDERPLNSAWLEGFSWSHLLKPATPPSWSVKPNINSSLQSIELPIINIRDHSIQDPFLYARKRIGDGVFELLKKNHISPLLYAGNPQSASHALNVPESAIHYIPSPYQDWGVYQGLVDGRMFPDGKARYLMVIPPSRHYLIHYSGLFSSIGLPPESAVLNVADQRQTAEIYKNIFRNLSLTKGFSPDVAVLGYFNDFKELLAKDARILTHTSVAEGLEVALIEEGSDAKKIKYLLVKSERTLWGELSQFLVEGMLEMHPKVIVFMGSAGGITPKSRLYDISVPEKFRLQGRDITLRNEVFEILKQRPEKTLGLTLGGVHGHTNSPIEQSKSFVSDQIVSGIDYYDVEQNLIAAALERYNKTHKVPVAFGALNLITDKPQSHHFAWQDEFDLTKIDRNSKSTARMRAITTALSALKVWKTNPRPNSCRAVFL